MIRKNHIKKDIFYYKNAGVGNNKEKKKGNKCSIVTKSKKRNIKREVIVYQSKKQRFFRSKDNVVCGKNTQWRLSPLNAYFRL